MNYDELKMLISKLEKIENVEDINLIKQAVNSCLTVQELKKQYSQNLQILHK